MFNLKNQNIDNSFLKNVEKFILIIIQTEGIYSNFCNMDLTGFKRLLIDLKESVEKNKFGEFIQKITL